MVIENYKKEIKKRSNLLLLRGWDAPNIVEPAEAYQKHTPKELYKDDRKALKL